MSVLRQVTTATLLQEVLLALLLNISLLGRRFEGISPVVFMPALPCQLCLTEELEPFWASARLHATAAGWLLCEGNCIADCPLKPTFPLVPKSLSFSASFTQAVVPSLGLSAGFPAPAGRDRFLSLLAVACLAPQSC